MQQISFRVHYHVVAQSEFVLVGLSGSGLSPEYGLTGLMVQVPTRTNDVSMRSWRS